MNLDGADAPLTSRASAYGGDVSRRDAGPSPSSGSDEDAVVGPATKVSVQRDARGKGHGGRGKATGGGGSGSGASAAGGGKLVALRLFGGEESELQATRRAGPAAPMAHPPRETGAEATSVEEPEAAHSRQRAGSRRRRFALRCCVIS